MSKNLNNFLKSLSINLIVDLTFLNILMFILSFLTPIEPNMAIFSCLICMMMDSICCIMSLLRNKFNEKNIRLQRYFTNLASWCLISILTIGIAIILKDPLVMKAINQIFQ
jgi:hypothetical protein